MLLPAPYKSRELDVSPAQPSRLQGQKIKRKGITIDCFWSKLLSVLRKIETGIRLNHLRYELECRSKQNQQRPTITTTDPHNNYQPLPHGRHPSAAMYAPMVIRSNSPPSVLGSP